MDDRSIADFKAADEVWQLEKLYLDLAKTKGKGLTPLEKKILQGLLCGYSPSEIAAKLYQNRHSTSVRVYLSNSLYKYLQDLFDQQDRGEVRISHWSKITNLLERAGYKKVPENISNLPSGGLFNNYRDDNLVATSNRPFYQDWEERIDLPHFVGREVELRQLETWIVAERSHIVALIGIFGIGKSSLAVKLIDEIKPDFQYIFWRSMRYPPTLDRLLDNLLDRLLGIERASPRQADSQAAKISLLLDFCASHRCLFVFNHFDRVFLSGRMAGTYQEEYRDYSHFWQRFGDQNHNSCCLILSRQQPREIALLEGEKIRSLYLSGLPVTAASQLLTQSGLIGSESEKEIFVNKYASIPLVLFKIYLTIKNLFNSNLTEFLNINTYLLSTILEVLDEEFRCLAKEEREILYALAVNQKLFKEGKFGKEFDYNLPKHLQIEAIESLQRRGLLLKNSRQLAHEPLLRTYIMEKLIEEIETALDNSDLAAIIRYFLSD
jgi:hypothetical protein